MDVPDRLLADRPEDDLRRVAARLEDDQRRAELDADQSRPVAPRSEDDGRVGRADHARTTPASRPTRVVFTIAPSPQDINTIWAGSDDGLVHVTRDGGQNWDNVTPKELPEFAR